jgi:hypothetical protein
MAQKDKIAYNTILPFTAGDYNKYKGIWIYVPTSTLIMDFFCLCDEVRKTNGFTFREGLHYFCLCHGHNSVYSLHCRLPSDKQIINLSSSRKDDRYFIIYDKNAKDSPNSNVPSLASLSKSATFQHKLENLTTKNGEFPKDLYDIKIRTKNCIITNCYMDLEKDCTKDCPDKTNICNNRSDRLTPYYRYSLWSKYPDDFKEKLKIWNGSREQDRI